MTIHGETPNRFWVERIATLTDDQVRAGLHRIGHGPARDYPCNLTEFVEACRGSGRRFNGVPETAAADRRRRLEHKGAPREVAERRITALRARLGMTGERPRASDFTYNPHRTVHTAIEERADAEAAAAREKVNRTASEV